MRRVMKAYGTIDDERLAELVKQGEVEAYAELMERYQPKMEKYIGGILWWSREEVDDLVSEILVRAYENMRGFRPGWKFSSWIYRIGHNLTVDWLKKQKGNKSWEIEENNVAMEESGEPEAVAVSQEREERVKRLMGKLETKYREVVWLYYFEDKSYEEIADILETTVSNVGVRLKRAKDFLKKYEQEK